MTIKVNSIPDLVKPTITSLNFSSDYYTLNDNTNNIIRFSMDVVDDRSGCNSNADLVFASTLINTTLPILVGFERTGNNTHCSLISLVPMSDYIIKILNLKWRGDGFFSIKSLSVYDNQRNKITYGEDLLLSIFNISAIATYSIKDTTPPLLDRFELLTDTITTNITRQVRITIFNFVDIFSS